MPGEVISLSSNYADFNREIVPMHMSNVQCVGTESRLTLCPHDQTSKGSGIVATQECIYYLDSKCNTLCVYYTYVQHIEFELPYHFEL